MSAHSSVADTHTWKPPVGSSMGPLYMEGRRTRSTKLTRLATPSRRLACSRTCSRIPGDGQQTVAPWPSCPDLLPPAARASSLDGRSSPASEAVHDGGDP